MPAPLSRETSLYLDAVRFLAALTVFFSHFAMEPLSGGFLWRIGLLGHDAVIVFFVMSGFVIAHATAQSERSAAVYFVNRAARLYSVVVPAIAITLACDWLGARLVAHYGAWSYSPGTLWQQLVASLTFTNQFWSLAIFPGSDLPYWSLGYEVPYYAIFGCALFAPGLWRAILPAALLVLAGPSIASLFPLWLAGVALYRFGRLRGLGEKLGWTLFLGSILAWLGFEAWVMIAEGGLIHAPIPFLAQEYLPTDYVTGICFAANLLGFEAVAHRAGAPLLRAKGAIRWAAGRTFTLYLVHFPVLKLCVGLAPWSPADWRTRVLAVAATFLVVIVAAALFERRKDAWRRVIAGLVSLPVAPPARTARIA